MRACIHQPNFLPYLGIFNKIKQSDIYVVYDVAQYVRDRFDNRNQIKGPAGPIWLTVPLQVKDSFLKRFFEVKLPDDPHWKKKHLRTIEHTYSRAAHFKTYFPPFAGIYEGPHATLADISVAIIEFLLKEFRIGTRVVRTTAMDLDSSLQSTEMIVQILKKLGVTRYLAGASGKKYMDMDLLAKEGIQVDFQHYDHPIYRQMYGAFVPNLAAIDLLFNEGENAGNLI